MLQPLDLTTIRQIDRANHLGSNGENTLGFSAAHFLAAVQRFDQPVHVVRMLNSRRFGVTFDRELIRKDSGDSSYELVATLPAIDPRRLGHSSFCETHRVDFPYIAGEMANGITTTKMVIEMSNAKMLSCFGAAGLTISRVEEAVSELCHVLGNRQPWGVNLIHSLKDPILEERMVDLFIERGVTTASASAFLQLTPSVVRYASTGLCMDATRSIRRKNRLLAKISRQEVARQFMSPAPHEILSYLVGKRLLTAREAELASRIPVAEDITVEADSGGHTDNRPLVILLPLILKLRDQIVGTCHYKNPIRIGAAGGLATPIAVAGAFAMGAAYVLTGSINQSAVESGLSDEGKQMLSRAGMTDVTMAPASDMFELGVKVQVLKRGTLFAVKAQKLYEIYVKHPSLQSISNDLKLDLEKNIFGNSLSAIWEETKRYWEKRNVNEVSKAEKDPKYQMALVFRWYLSKASRWAIEGEPTRRVDYQIWCGPAMGAFNDWVTGSFLAELRHRKVVQIALNLLEGAAHVIRAQQLCSCGVPVPEAAFQFKPRLHTEYG